MYTLCSQDAQTMIEFSGMSLSSEIRSIAISWYAYEESNLDLLFRKEPGYPLHHRRYSKFQILFPRLRSSRARHCGQRRMSMFLVPGRGKSMSIRFVATPDLTG